MDQPPLHPGQRVHVYAAGAWRPGRIIKTAKTRGLVEFERNRRGDLTTKALPLSDIHPARGVRLVRVDHLTRGTVIVLPNGDRTVDTSYRSAPRNRLIRFTDTTELVVAAGTTLRARRSP